MPTSNGRYLTEKEKSSVLQEWERTLEQWRAGAINGVGEPDARIIPWCNRINNLPGVCTLQSCAGHRNNGVITPAHFWLWLSPGASKRFDQNAFLLLKGAENVDWVSRHYLSSGKEIASITFFGDERGILETSALFIYDFLCGIADDQVSHSPLRSLDRHSLSSSPVVGRPDVLTDS